MQDLIKHLIEDQNRIDEIGWRQMLGGAAIAGALLAGTPQVADAAPKHHHHAGLPSKSYSEQDILNAIVGEASNQGYNGMLGIANAIRNRAKLPYYKNNILHGVYGINNPIIKKVSPKIFELAKKAWDESATNDNTNGASFWGTDSDLVKFNKQAWFKNLEPTVRIKDHTFFKIK